MSALLLILLAAFAQEPAKSPHGATDGCAACHAPADAAGVWGAPLPVVATCRTCHPTADMHPVGMAPDKVVVSESYPLEDGKVTCATCHSEPAHGEPYASLPSPWHRGGPYPELKQFCYSCHDAKRYTRQSPHVFEGDTASTGSCSACHTALPERASDLPEHGGVADPHLRESPDLACAHCHEGDTHAGLRQHMGKAVPGPRAAMLPSTVPLHEGTIQCWTCHDVHSAGPASYEPSELARALHEAALASEWSQVPAGAVWPGDREPAMLALGTPELCMTCHGEGPE